MNYLLKVNGVQVKSSDELAPVMEMYGKFLGGILGNSNMEARSDTIEMTDNVNKKILKFTRTMEDIPNDDAN